ncbi:ubiquitin thioesterase ZRANB1-like [Eucyclogobius newberryi]|uniref:ubiquitin thioesterase ZRANB1-like n=1 Tax=Eucyclogobius newberryi TaxID=166745 RepID=UPI003B5C5628
MTEPKPCSVMKWPCDYCTYENWPSAVKCTMCRAPRPPPVIREDPFATRPDPDPDSDLSRAETGTAGLLICPDSSARPRVPPSGANELANKWSCLTCTFLNWPRAIRCTQCSRRRSKPAGPASESAQTCSAASGSHSPIEEHNDRNRLNAQWTCAACMYQNWAESAKCVVCDGPKRQEAERANADDQVVNERERSRRRTAGGGGGGSAAQRRLPPLGRSDVQRIELAAGAMSANEEQEVDQKKLKQIRNRMRKNDWLFLNACAGVVDGDLAAVEAYKASAGDISRQLSADEVQLLNRSSAFDVGFTLVHLAIRFQRQDMLALLLTEVSQQRAKRIPSLVCPELTEQIRREISSCLHQRKEPPCSCLSELHTFTLPAEIEDLPPAVQEKLFDEVLDRDVQKELEESLVINWSLELVSGPDSRLYALWNRSAGDCLLDSVLQASWGVCDTDSVLRRALHQSLNNCSHWFYSRWKEWESWYSQSCGLHFSLREEQWREDWAFILSLASQPGASLEQTHIFVLCHILRRPIVVYGVKYYKSFRGETLGYTRFQGVYLPLLWEQSFCWKSPIALGYTRGHFSALVSMETDGYDNRGAGANLNSDDVPATLLPLVDSDRKLLPVHFLSTQEMGTEEQHERLLRSWLDCCVTEGGTLAAMQRRSGRCHPLVTQMTDRWLDRYRHLSHCAFDEEDEEDE